MDKELKDVLTKLLEGQNELASEVGNLKNEVSGLNDKVTNLSEGQDSLKNEVQNLSKGQNSLKSEVQKNSIKLESIENKIDTIAEVQKNHMDQNEKAHKEIIKPLDEKVDVIGLAVKNTSKDMKELKDKFDKVEKVTDRKSVV